MLTVRATLERDVVPSFHPLKISALWLLSCYSNRCILYASLGWFVVGGGREGRSSVSATDTGYVLLKALFWPCLISDCTPLLQINLFHLDKRPRRLSWTRLAQHALFLSFERPGTSPLAMWWPVGCVKKEEKGLWHPCACGKFLRLSPFFLNLLHQAGVESRSRDSSKYCTCCSVR